MKFLIDMPLSPALAACLLDQGHDAFHSSSVGLAKATDAEIMKIARREGRTIVTADLDYSRLLAEIKATDPSLIPFRDGDWSETEVISRMEDVLKAVPEAQIGGSIIVVDKQRIRRRDLPL